MNASALKRVGAVLAAAAMLGMFAACTPTPDYPPMLAVAYSNLDGVDGFHAGQDVLIARLVDTNRDGVVSVGDTVETGRYPLDFDGTGFGVFRARTHTVAVVQSPLGISVRDADGASFNFGSGPGAESYREYSETGSPRVEIIDVYFTLDPFFATDEIRVEPGAPSDPDTAVEPWITAPWDAYDSFIDVDTFI